MKKTILTASILVIAFSGCMGIGNPNITVSSNNGTFKGDFKDNQLLPIELIKKGDIKFQNDKEGFVGKCNVIWNIASEIGEGTCVIPYKNTTCDIKVSNDNTISTGTCTDRDNTKYTILGD